MFSFDEAVACVRAGGLVVYPTETFFGVGCKACDFDAVARVYQAKRRDVHLPLPVIVAGEEHLRAVARSEPALEALIQSFWPGPLTVLLPALGHVPPLLTGGTGRIALRVSSHPVAHALSEAVGEALVSSSANISGRPAVTRVEQLDPELLQRVDGILAQGPVPAGGAPSTLVEWVQSSSATGAIKPVGCLRLLRLGAVSVQDLEHAGYTVLGPARII